MCWKQNVMYDILNKLNAFIDIGLIFFSYFLLEQKVTKIQGFRKICCVSNPEVLSRNTRHESLVQIKAFVVAVYCYAHAIRTYLRQEPLTYFSEAGPFYESLLL
jgi:hypothetical protein